MGKLRCAAAVVAACLRLLIAEPELIVAAPPRIEIHSPLAHQVVQRVGYQPLSTTEPQPGPGPAPTEPAPTEPAPARLGSAVILVTGTAPEPGLALEYRTVLLAAAAGGDTPWIKVPAGLSSSAGRDFRFELTLPAGGWYRLELRSAAAGASPAAVGMVEPIGVGEVFLVAGQSYATNTNEELLSVTDPQLRVVAFDNARHSWSVANDPQPTPDGSQGGSIWPALGDALVQELQVPIAFANVAVGGTSSAQWLPEGELHPRLVQAGKSLGRFRAVLWQQGESDVLAGTSSQAYIDNLRRIRKAAVRGWGFEPVWLAAKSTHHPTVYDDPAGEARIRGAIEQLAALPGFGAGPDTDRLQGENRGDANSRRHFSAIGQRRAAALWQQVLSERLRSVPVGVPAASFLLPDLQLLEPAWSSEIVQAESSLIRRLDGEPLPEARLAFPAIEILKVTTADRLYQFDVSDACVLREGHDRLQFKHLGPIDPLANADLFLPVGSPHSYQHRVGHPEQSLLYQPGRWFHDRDVEVTYRRDLTQSPLASQSMIHGSLPKTMARLNSGEPLTLGISGDSISTGLDASVMTAAPPFQPGFPELVVAQLQVLFDSDIALKNRAVAGWSVANGVADLEALLAEQPQLIIVAYGMNDVGRRDPKWFAEQTRMIIERVQAANSDTEIILVSPMLGNPEWIHTPYKMFADYRDELTALVAPGVAVADVTAVWDLLLRRKEYLDLTGNGLNHPNDFGHRLYAQALLQLFVQRP